MTQIARIRRDIDLSYPRHLRFFVGYRVRQNVGRTKIPTRDHLMPIQDIVSISVDALRSFAINLLDIFVGGLSGGYCPPAPPHEVECNNVLLLAFDPDRFSGLTHFMTQSQGLCDFVRSAKPAIANSEIRLPHDHSRQTHAQRLVNGVPLDRGTWQQLVECAKRAGVSVPVEGK